MIQIPVTQENCQVIAGLRLKPCFVNPMFLIREDGVLYDTRPEALGRRHEFCDLGRVVPRRLCHGYFHYPISTPGAVHRGRNVKLHQLVAHAFIGPPPFAGAVVRHLNDVKTDNRIENLAWGTQQDNHDDMRRNGCRKRVARGESSGMSRLKEAQVRSIRRMYKQGIMMKDIAALYGIAESTVSLLCSGARWKHLDPEQFVI